MRRAVGALAIVVCALAAGAVPATAAKKKRPTCFPPHSKTLQIDAKVRVFKLRHSIYGCLLKRKKLVKFKVGDFPTGFGPIELAAPYVAYASYSDCAAAFCDPNTVVLQDLRGGRATFVDGQAISVAELQSLVLKPNGSLAFITSEFDQNGSILPGVAVVKVEAGGTPVTLDSGAGVQGDSLALAGSTLYWTNAGVARSAPLG